MSVQVGIIMLTRMRVGGGVAPGSAGTWCKNSGPGATLLERKNKAGGRPLADAVPKKQY